MYSYIFYLKAKAKQTFILKGAHARTSCGWDSEPRRRPSAFAPKRSVQTLRTLPKVQFDFNPGASGYRLVHHVRRRGKIRNRAESAHWENEVFWLGERAPPAGCGEPRAVCKGPVPTVLFVMGSHMLPIWMMLCLLMRPSAAQKPAPEGGKVFTETTSESDTGHKM